MAIRLDDGPPIPVAWRLVQQPEVRTGITPSATHMIRMQPPLDERQVIVRDIAKAQAHDDMPPQDEVSSHDPYPIVLPV
jgi:hypothetical protein